MSIQEIPLSNKQKKKLLKAIELEEVLFEDDNGDLVVNVEAYLSIKNTFKIDPIESIVGDQILNFKAEYFVFN